MKKILLFLLLPLFLYAGDFAGKFGLEFGLSSFPTVGVKYHFTDVYAISPRFGISLNKEAGESKRLEFSLGNQFYLPPIGAVDHFINVGGGGLFYTDSTGTMESVVNVNDHNIFYCGVGWGIEYHFSDHVAAWGVLNLTSAWDSYTHTTNFNSTPQQIVNEDTDWLLSLSRSGVGVTFYFK